MRRNKKHTPQNPRTKTAPAANTTTTTVTNTPVATSSLPTSASSVQISNNPEFGDVRVVMQDGEPWFVGKDVANALGYERATKAIQDHVDFEDKDGVPIQDSIGRMQKTPIISESGLYSLILSSKLPSAKKFKRWVTSEVLPTIRKTGGYVDQSRNRIKIIRDYEEKFINRTIELFYDKRVIILKSRLLTLFFLYYITVVKLHVKSRRLSACFCIFLVNL